MEWPSEWLVPDWPAPAGIRALFTTRAGGVSTPPFDSFNLGDHVRDDPAAVATNRQRLRVQLALVLGFFLGGLMGALGFKYWGYITTVPLAALLWVLCLRPLLNDLRWRAA